MLEKEYRAFIKAKKNLLKKTAKKVLVELDPTDRTDTKIAKVLECLTTVFEIDTRTPENLRIFQTAENGHPSVTGEVFNELYDDYSDEALDEEEREERNQRFRPY